MIGRPRIFFRHLGNRGLTNSIVLETMVKVWDILGVAACGWGVYQCFFALPLPEHLKNGGNFQFLTNCGVFVLLLYAVYNLLGLPQLRKFHALVAALEFEITVAYWYFIFFSPGLINTDSYTIRLIDDLLFHLFPYIYILGKRVPSVSFKQFAAIAAAGFFGYWAYVEYLVAYCDAIYPYPFLRGQPLVDRAKHFAIFYVVGLIQWVVETLKSSSTTKVKQS